MGKLGESTGPDSRNARWLPRAIWLAATFLVGRAPWMPSAAAEEVVLSRQPGAIEPRQETPEAATTPGAGRPTKPYGWRQLDSDFHYLLRRPSRMDRQDRFHLYTAAGAVGGLYLLRGEIRDWAQEHRNDSRSAFYQDVRLISRGAAAPGLALFFYAASFATGNDRERETGWMLLESALFSSAGAVGGSFTLATERPEIGNDIRVFNTEGHGVSLDAALGASLVEPLRCQYLRVEASDKPGRRALKRGMSTLLYTAAGLVAYQRVDDDKHWAPDATLGVLLGLGVGRTLCEAHGRRPGRPGEESRELQEPRVAFAPVALPGGLGVGVRVRLGR